MSIVVFCVIAFVVLRALDWVIPSPPRTILVCIEDYDKRHDCKKYTEEQVRE